MFGHIRAFHQPRSVPEAIRLLSRGGTHTALVAGGTDVVLRAGRSVTDLVDVSHLGLDYIRRAGGVVRIGAATTLAELEHSPLVQRLAAGILAKSAACCGGVQTRNLATIGGNLCNASPAADTATPLLVLDAQVLLRSLRGRRQLALADFFRAPHQTAAPGCLLIEISIPLPNRLSAWSFQRFARTELDVALVNAAVGLACDRAGRCTWARVALGAVAPRPIRALQVEKFLAGKSLCEKTLAEAGEIAAHEIRPISDLRASAEYRRELTRILLRRALQECAQQLECAL